MSFKEWIKKFSDEDSPLGDLASDVGSDDRFPRHSRAYYQIHNHLIGMSACDDALDTFEVAWNLYEKEVMTHGSK